MSHILEAAHIRRLMEDDEGFMAGNLFTSDEREDTGTEESQLISALAVAIAQAANDGEYSLLVTVPPTSTSKVLGLLTKRDYVVEPVSEDKYRVRWDISPKPGIKAR